MQRNRDIDGEIDEEKAKTDAEALIKGKTILSGNHCIDNNQTSHKP